MPTGLGGRLAWYFEHRPLQFFYWVLLGQVLLWTLIPVLLFRSQSLDMIENIAWSRDLQLGYYKHPPLQVWTVELGLRVFGGAVWPLFLLGPAAIAATFIPIFLMGRQIGDERAGLLAVLLFSLVFYANIAAPEFNANIVQLPIWAWAAFVFWRAIERNRMGWWVLLGLLLSLAVYAKYSAAILVLTLIVAGLTQPLGRARLRSAGPYLATAISLLLSAPHFYWLWQSGWLPVTYAVERADELSALGRFMRPIGFTAVQILDHIAALAVLAIGGGAWAGRSTVGAVSFTAEPSIRRYVTVLAVAPIGISALISTVTGEGLRDMWGAPMIVWLSLALLLWIRPVYVQRRLPAMLGAWLALFVATPLALGFASLLGPAIGAAPLRTAWPSPELAQQLTAIWREETGKPLKLVAGDTWESGLVSTYSPDAPSVFVQAIPRINPWVDAERIARDGVLVVWNAALPYPFMPYESLGPFTATGEVTAPFGPASKVPAVHFRWAIRPPQPS